MDIYSEKNYKKLLIIPIILAVISVFYALQVEQGIEFKGGMIISFPANTTPDQVTSDLAQFNLEEVKVRTSSGAVSGIVVEFAGQKSLILAQEALDNNDYEAVLSTLSAQLPEGRNITDYAPQLINTRKAEFKQSVTAFISSQYSVEPENISFREVGPSLGAVFLSQMQNALFFAFVLMSVLVFIFFRKIIVSAAVIHAALFDVLVGLGFIGFMRIPLSLATVAPLLMLVGYSVDTDIMLTDRILSRKEGTAKQRMHSAMRTGLTMTGTTLAALMAMYITSSFGGVETLATISLILFVDLIGDLISTWCTNAVALLWIVRRRKK